MWRQDLCIDFEEAWAEVCACQSPGVQWPYAFRHVSGLYQMVLCHAGCGVNLDPQKSFIAWRTQTVERTYSIVPDIMKGAVRDF